MAIPENYVPTPLRVKKAKKTNEVVRRGRKTYSDNFKREAVVAYIQLGSLQLVGAAMKVPEPTLRTWRGSSWWQEMEAEVKSTENLVLSARLKKILEKTIELAEDRLENGDIFYDQKLGKIVRKEVGLRDVVAVMQTAAQQRTNILTSEQQAVATETMSQKLDMLAQRFAEMSKKPKQIEAEVIDNEEN